jgi:uncharacterized protein (DUF302 family)
MSDGVTKKNQVFEGVRLEVTTSAGFDVVLDRLRNSMGRTSIPEIVELAQKPIGEAEYRRVIQERFVGKSGFMLFHVIDHGGWLSKFGIRRRMVRWIFGNPLIAITMIRHDLTAGLFAPVEILITEAEDGQGTTITYVRPSSLMVLGNNPPLMQAAVELDKKLDELISAVVASGESTCRCQASRRAAYCCACSICRSTLTCAAAWTTASRTRSRSASAR